MTNIQNFTLDDERAIQRSWMFDSIACGRLPEEYHLPIVCEVTLSAREKPHSGPNPLGAGAEWELFRPCCPINNTTNGITNRYYTEYTCISKYCATVNESLAENWGTCVENAVNQSRAANSTPITVNSRCEWVDYDLVSKGREEQQSRAATLAGVRVWGVAASLMVALAAHWL